MHPPDERSVRSPAPEPTIVGQATLVRALRDPKIFGPPTLGVTVIETHISHVLLTGPYAYKIK